MTYVTTLTFPWPKLPLSMNDRLHRRVHAERNAAIRDAGQEAAAGIPRLARCRVTFTWVVTTRNRRDGINACATLKPLCDGLVRAGVVPDDTPEFMETPMPVIEWRNPRDGHVAHVELRIEEIP